MGNSLLDQLKKSGLVDEKKANKAQKEKHKQAKKQRQSNAIDANKLQLQQQQVEKIQHDRELNLQRKKEADKRAIQAQIKQLIELNQITDYDGEISYNFTDNNIIKSLHLSENALKQLNQGRLAIVKLNNRYKLVPTAVAEKISLRDEQYVIQYKTPQQDEEDDCYADYKVPDDLMW